jgi:hypothetical protein
MHLLTFVEIIFPNLCINSWQPGLHEAIINLLVPLLTKCQQYT